MFTQFRLALAVATLAVGCGRVGVRLLPELSDAGTFEAVMDASIPVDAASGSADASSGPRDAATGAMDASSTPVRDAGNPRDATTTPMDASPPTDASPGADAQPDAGRTTSCAGEVLFNLCWYLAPADTSCNSQCASHGGHDINARRHVGTTEEGGSAADCSAILAVLRGPGEVVVATRDENEGLGCHVWSDGTYYWLDDPSSHFDPNYATPSDTQVRIACGCLR